MAPPIFRVQRDILTKNNPNIIKLVLGLLSYINMTEEEKEDYLYEYIDTFVEALYNKSGEH
jgi:hypothetical protein